MSKSAREARRMSPYIMLYVKLKVDNENLIVII